MRNKILIIGALIIVVVIGIAVYVIDKPSSPVPAATNTGTTLPVASPSNQNPGSGTTGSNGNAITVQDLLHATTTTEDASNPGLYHLNMPPSASSSAAYDITYESATQYFNITLLAEPLGQTRIAMENYLMAKLGISESAMCKLNYMVTVPYSVNSFYSGESLGFSFCPGAPQLPN